MKIHFHYTLSPPSSSNSWLRASQRPVLRFRFLFALFLGCAAPVCRAPATDILTNRGDNARTGLNANETVLTPSFVTSSSFGLVYNNPVDGQVYA